MTSDCGLDRGGAGRSEVRAERAGQHLPKVIQPKARVVHSLKELRDRYLGCRESHRWGGSGPSELAIRV